MKLLGMVMEKTDRIMCAVCGIYGTVKVESGETSINFPKEVWDQSRLSMKEKAYHGEEIFSLIQRTFPFVKTEVPVFMQKYKDYNVKVMEPQK